MVMLQRRSVAGSGFSTLGEMFNGPRVSVLAKAGRRTLPILALAIAVYLATAIVAGLGSVVPAVAQPKEPAETRSVPPLPDPETLAALVRWTILAVSQANVTGNYTVLRELGSPGFQSANTSAKLALIFSGIRDQNIDLSFAVTATPQLSQPPSLDAKGILKVVGFYATRPLQINFDLSFEAVTGIWRHSDIGLAAGPPLTANTAPNQKAPPDTGKSKKATSK
jgi:hypothetical protein